MGWMFDNVGRLIGRLQKPAQGYEPFTPNDSTALRDPLRPGDVLLVEGNNHISGVIKNIINLMRYLFPWPVTQRRRRRMITLGSGDTTMSYDLRVRSQAHYLIYWHVPSLIFWTDAWFPIPENACAERRKADFGGYPVAFATFCVDGMKFALRC